MSREFVLGTEYMVAKKETAKRYTVAIIAESKRGGGELTELVDREFTTKTAAIKAIKSYLAMFPGIEITYVGPDSDSMDPWFRDWEYR